MTVKPFSERLQRIHLLYDGRVQGVGFRFTFEIIARELVVTGYVRNLPDGTVEAVCEGIKENLDLVVDKVSRRMGGYIKSSTVTEEKATGEFKNFRILI